MANILSKYYWWIDLIAPSAGAWVAPVGSGTAAVDRISITSAQTEIRDADGVLVDIATLMPDRCVLILDADFPDTKEGFSRGILRTPISDIPSLAGKISGLWSRDTFHTQNIFEYIRELTEAAGKKFRLSGAQIDLYLCSGHAPGLIHFADDIWRTIGDNEPVELSAGAYDYDDIVRRVFRGRIRTVAVRNSDISLTAESDTAVFADNIATTIGSDGADAKARTVPIVIGQLVPTASDQQALAPLVSQSFLRDAIVFRAADQVEDDTSTEVFFVEAGGRVGRVRDLVSVEGVAPFTSEVFRVQMPQNNSRDLGDGYVAISGTDLTAGRVSNLAADAEFTLGLSEQSILLPEVDQDVITRDLSIAHEPPVVRIGSELVRLIGLGDYPKAAAMSIAADGFCSHTDISTTPHERGFEGTTQEAYLGGPGGATQVRVNSQGNNLLTSVLWRTAPQYIREFYNRRAATNNSAIFGDANSQKRAGISGSVAGVLRNSNLVAWGETPGSDKLIFSARNVGPEYKPDGTSANVGQRWASRLWTQGYGLGDGEDHWFGNGYYATTDNWPHDYNDGRFLLLCPPPKVDAGELHLLMEASRLSSLGPLPTPQVGWLRVQVKGRIRIVRQAGETAPVPVDPDLIWQGAFGRVEIGAIQGFPVNRANMGAGYTNGAVITFAQPEYVAYLPGDGVSDLLEFDETRFVRVEGTSIEALWESKRLSEDPYQELISPDAPVPVVVRIETNAVYPGGTLRGDGRKTHIPGDGVVSPEVEIDYIVVEFCTKKEFERGNFYAPVSGIASDAVDLVRNRVDIATKKLSERVAPGISLVSLGGAGVDANILNTRAQGFVQQPNISVREIVRSMAQHTHLRFFWESTSTIYVTSILDTTSRTVDHTIEIDDLSLDSSRLADLSYSYSDAESMLTGIELRFKPDVRGRSGSSVRITHNEARGDDGRFIDPADYSPTDQLPTFGNVTAGTIAFYQSLFADALDFRGSDNIDILEDAFCRNTPDAMDRLGIMARTNAVELLSIRADVPANRWIDIVKLSTLELGESLRGILPDRIIDNPAYTGTLAKRRYLYEYGVLKATNPPMYTITLQELPR
jgi:hypothetical protein